MSELVQPVNNRVTVKLYGQLSPDGKTRQRAEVKRGKQEEPGKRMSLEQYKQFNKQVQFENLKAGRKMV